MNQEQYAIGYHHGMYWDGCQWRFGGPTGICVPGPEITSPASALSLDDEITDRDIDAVMAGSSGAASITRPTSHRHQRR